MLNRRHIRVKVMQVLYAFGGDESKDLKKDKNFLMSSLENMYDLYISILALLIELHKKSKTYNKTVANKLLASSENEPSKLEHNKLLIRLASNSTLENIIADRKLNFWDLDFEYVDVIFKDILKNDIHKSFNEKETTFKDDVNFILELYKDCIAPNDKLYDYFEDKKITWADDIPLVNTLMLKVLKKVKTTSSESQVLPDLYKNDDDEEFAIDLFKKTVLNTVKFSEEIEKKAINWDKERLASLDGVLLKMAICEFQKFPSIPYKVTINEYLEIAKEYSTPKSSVFINGILDKIVKEYKVTNTTLKAGRGLM